MADQGTLKWDSKNLVTNRFDYYIVVTKPRRDFVCSYDHLTFVKLITTGRSFPYGTTSTASNYVTNEIPMWNIIAATIGQPGNLLDRRVTLDKILDLASAQ